MDPFRSMFQKPAPTGRSCYRSPFALGFPGYDVQPALNSRHPPNTKQRPREDIKSFPKVLQIPVQFWGSNPNRRSEAALKIQKAFRGFLVRKCVRKIRDIKFQVDEIDARLSASKVVDMIRENGKERLRISENLMNLLLKLDGIAGVDLGVRMYRKGVTKRVIALQEKIDSIVGVDSENFDDLKSNSGIKGQEMSDPTSDLVTVNCCSDTVDCEIGNCGSSKEFGDMLGKSMEVVGRDSVKGLEERNVTNAEVVCEKGSAKDDVNLWVEVEGEDRSVGGKASDSESNMVLFENCGGNGELLHDVEDHAETEAADNEILCEVNPCEDTYIEKRTSCNLDSDEVNVKKEFLHHVPLEIDCKKGKSDVNEREGEKKRKDEAEEDSKSSFKMLEKMMEANAKLMRMMTQLSESNEVQLQMINALTNRVEFLEKANECEKLRNRRKKKKAKSSSAAAFCLEE